MYIVLPVREEECRKRMKQLKRELARVKKEKEKEVAVSSFDLYMYVYILHGYVGIGSRWLKLY